MIKSQDIFNIEAITVAPYSHKERNETVISGREKSYNEILKICNWLEFDTTNKVFKGAEDYSWQVPSPAEPPQSAAFPAPF